MNSWQRTMCCLCEDKAARHIGKTDASVERKRPLVLAPTENAIVATEYVMTPSTVNGCNEWIPFIQMFMASGLPTVEVGGDSHPNTKRSGICWAAKKLGIEGQCYPVRRGDRCYLIRRGEAIERRKEAARQSGPKTVTMSV